MKAHATIATTAAPHARDALFGVLLGIGGLVSIALVLGVVDPALRDPDGQVFSISGVLAFFGIFN
jgi:hypothetical protein